MAFARRNEPARPIVPAFFPALSVRVSRILFSYGFPYMAAMPWTPILLIEPCCELVMGRPPRVSGNQASKSSIDIGSISLRLVWVRALPNSSTTASSECEVFFSDALLLQPVRKMLLAQRLRKNDFGMFTVLILIVFCRKVRGTEIHRERYNFLLCPLGLR